MIGAVAYWRRTTPLPVGGACAKAANEPNSVAKSVPAMMTRQASVMARENSVFGRGRQPIGLNAASGALRRSPEAIAALALGRLLYAAEQLPITRVEQDMVFMPEQAMGGKLGVPGVRRPPPADRRRFARE